MPKQIATAVMEGIRKRGWWYKRWIWCVVNTTDNRSAVIITNTVVIIIVLNLILYILWHVLQSAVCRNELI